MQNWYKKMEVGKLYEGKFAHELLYVIEVNDAEIVYMIRLFPDVWTLNKTGYHMEKMASIYEPAKSVDLASMADEIQRHYAKILEVSVRCDRQAKLDAEQRAYKLEWTEKAGEALQRQLSQYQ